MSCTSAGRNGERDLFNSILQALTETLSLPAAILEIFMVKIRLLSGKQGVTLMESLIASLIMGISIFAIGTAIYSQVNALNQNREKTIAALAAQGEIENIRGMAFNNISSHTFDTTEAPGLAYLHKPPNVATRGSVLVSNSYGSDIKKVSVTITWISMTGKTLQNNLETLITRSGIDKQ